MKVPYGEAARRAMARKEPGAAEAALAALVVCWADMDGFFPSALGAASMAQLHDKPHAACALDVVNVLRHSPQGRKALGNLGFQQFFEHVEGNGAA